jgi:hypothetical protein
MMTPTTELDARFSEPGASATPWDDARQVLEDAQLFWLTTVRVDGRPQTTPLVAVWLDGALHFTTGADEQKARNLDADPHVTLLTGCNRWDDGVDIVVEGDAVRATDDALLRHLADAWRAKWDGRWRWEVRDGALVDPQDQREALVFTVAPTKVLAFGKGTFTQTRYRF